MAFEPKRALGVPGSSGEPVQLASPSEDVSLDWASNEADRQLAERMKRLEGDVEVVTLLALSNFDGDRWDLFATELARYGMAVVGGWMFKGLIYEKCRSKGFGLAELGRPFTGRRSRSSRARQSQRLSGTSSTTCS